MSSRKSVKYGILVSTGSKFCRYIIEKEYLVWVQLDLPIVLGEHLRGGNASRFDKMGPDIGRERYLGQAW